MSGPTLCCQHTPGEWRVLEAASQAGGGLDDWLADRRLTRDCNRYLGRRLPTARISYSPYWIFSRAIRAVERLVWP